MSFFRTSRYYEGGGGSRRHWTKVFHRYKSVSRFDYIQTFYVNPETVSNADSALITSVDLFFKNKPNTNRNISGLTNPGITVSLCEVSNEEPKLDRVIEESIVNIPYERINTSSNAETATTVSFASPVRVETGKFYGLIIKYTDPAFVIWENIQGHKIVRATGTTETPSPGSLNRFDGRCYRGNNIALFDPHWQRDIKFKINIAKFNTDVSANTPVTQSFNLVNKPYEFFTTNASSGVFQGGEWVYRSNQSNEAGTLNLVTSSKEIVGTGTNFTNAHLGLYAVVSDGVSEEVLNITSVTNTTHMTVDRFPDVANSAATYKLPPIGKMHFSNPTANSIVLKDSNAANATFKFTAGDTIKGVRSTATGTIASLDRLQIDKFMPNFLVGNPSTSSFTTTYALTTEANTISATENELVNQAENKIGYKAYILSRSQEVIEAGMFGVNNRSAYANITFTVTSGGANSYAIPYIKSTEIDFDSMEHLINSTTLATVNGITDFDTEVNRNGLGKSKHITSKVTFGENRYAEDVVVYLTGYRPSGTEIKVYAKIHNSADKETLDDKAWTPLELKTNVDSYSGEDKNDLVEYRYGLPEYPPVHLELDGTFVTQSGNAVITSTVDHSANVASGDLILLRAPLFPENNEVFVVDSANSTSITATKPVTNVNIIGEVLVDKLKYKDTAWSNRANDNVARYVTSSKVEFDYYNTMQFKIVLLADNSHVVPEVEQFQAIGASA